VFYSVSVRNLESSYVTHISLRPVVVMTPQVRQSTKTKAILTQNTRPHAPKNQSNLVPLTLLFLHKKIPMLSQHNHI
jgi:hypothetical protein